MLTNKQLRNYLRETLEYSQNLHYLSEGSFLVQTARRLLRNADNEKLNYAHENLIKLDKRLQIVYSDAIITKQGLTLEEVSDNLEKILPTITNILWANENNIRCLIDKFINNICKRCGFETI